MINVWFDILKKEKPIAANYSTKRILALADKIEELVAEVKIYAPPYSQEKSRKLTSYGSVHGASIQFSLEDVKGQIKPVGWIWFRDFLPWKKRQLDSIRDIRNSYMERIEEIDRNDRLVGYAKKRALETAHKNYRKGVEKAKKEANKETHYLVFRWHSRNARYGHYIDNLDASIVLSQLPDPEVQKYDDDDSIIQMIKELKDFIKEKQFSWEEGSS